MRTLKKGKKKKGFTLIELIAVVAILIILAVILVPNIVNYVNKSKIATVKSNAKVVLNIIKTAKAQSSTPDSITKYTDAIDTSKGGDPDLKASKDPSAKLQSTSEDDLEKLIDNTDNTWSTYKDYYDGTTTSAPKPKS